MHIRHCCTAAACLLTALGLTDARAQGQTLLGSEIPFDYSRGRNISVSEKARPGYDPVGMTVGSFIAYPIATVSVDHDSNVYASQTNAVGDFVASFRPSLSLNSQWSRHALNLSGGAQFARYFDENSQNRDLWNLGASGRVDISSDALIEAGSGIANRVEPRTSDNGLADIATPVRYRQSGAQLRGIYRTGRTRIVLAGDYNDFRFSPVTTLGGSVISQAARDREVARATVQLEYALSPSFALFGQLNYTGTYYDDDLTAGAANRDSNSIRGIVGVSMDLAALLRGSFGIGYTKRGYKSAIYQDNSALALEGRLEYFLSERTTATLAARRSLEDAVVLGAGGFVSSSVTLHLDQEVRSNIILTADAGYQRADYKGRPDHANVWNIGAGARYLANSWLAFGLNLNHLRRSGEGLATRPYYKQTVAGISLTVQR